MKKILVLNGPNLNLLGTREPEHYGQTSLAEVVATLARIAASHGVELVHFQTNAEDALIEAVQNAQGSADFLIINAGAYTHTSIALRDALLAVNVPFIEVHMTNVYARDTFRQVSYLADIAVGVIVGLGVMSYELALLAACRQLQP
ncbi:MAG: type II 3-dehydroquinate dehydratase [Gammaproteobacteria bacterium RIFCSPHIGHO2_12_FULL_45_9]|nr:MAG: type II 3-dehydroquinate dehydratase [Gammaproteobacteria bacterium RIFCSPHIGHO2_12_FULL_45_9]